MEINHSLPDGQHTPGAVIEAKQGEKKGPVIQKGVKESVEEKKETPNKEEKKESKEEKPVNEPI